MKRLDDLRRFYFLIESLCDALGGRIRLADLKDHVWPKRGVYFFFDDNEQRHESGIGPRVVRVGTHALNPGSRSSLRQRLAQHRGKNTGGGNHRGSIFRLLVGQALLARGKVPACPSWGVKGDIAKAAATLNIDRTVLLAAEQTVEEAVSAYLSRLTFVRLNVDDEAASNSLRGLIERNAIALLSNFERPPLDPSSPNWLGQSSDRHLVAKSGLWNQRHVTEEHDPRFLAILSDLIEQEFGYEQRGRVSRR